AASTRRCPKNTKPRRSAAAAAPPVRRSGQAAASRAVRTAAAERWRRARLQRSLSLWTRLLGRQVRTGRYPSFAAIIMDRAPSATIRASPTPMPRREPDRTREAAAVGSRILLWLPIERGNAYDFGVMFRSGAYP